MPQIEEGGMEHDGCCFIIGTGAAGRDHLSGADAAAVRTAALVITVFRPWYLAHIALADGIFFALVGLAALSWVVTLIRAVREMIW